MSRDGKDEKVKIVKQSAAYPFRRHTYAFWRRAGLAPWCSLRFAIQYRLGIGALIILMAACAFAQSVPTISSTLGSLASGQISGSHFGTAQGDVYVQPRLILTDSMRAAGLTDKDASHVLANSFAANRIKLKSVTAWTDSQIVVEISASEKSEIEQWILGRAADRLPVRVTIADFSYVFQVETPQGEDSDWK